MKTNAMEKLVNENFIREITPLSDKDCFYIADRHKKEFTYPMHSHKEFELNFVEHAPGVHRVVGDSAEVIGDYDLVLITSPDLEHVWEQNTCSSSNIREITIQFVPAFLSGLIDTNQFDMIPLLFQRFHSRSIIKAGPPVMPAHTDSFQYDLFAFFVYKKGSFYRQTFYSCTSIYTTI